MKPNEKQITLIGFLANLAEWYDFSIYIFLASSIGEIFFVTANHKIALIKALFLFSASYLIRPVGAIFWGYFGDRFGRKKALRWTLISMAVPTIVIGLLPTYSNIGIVATFLLIFFRLIQGFASGGELPISACYVYEAAPQEKKNFFCSFVAASSMLGMLSGSIAAFLVYYFFTAESIIAYAWRIPFIFGIVVFFLILYIRRNVEETSEFKVASNKVNYAFMRRIFLDLDTKILKTMLQIMVLYAFIQSSFYLLFVWMPSYLSVFLHVDKIRSFFSNTIGLFFLVMFTLLIGYFSKTIKQKKLIILGVISITIFAYPLFLLLQTKSLVFIIIAQTIFALCLGCIDGVIMHILGQSFDTQIRCSGISISFVLPTAIFGGILPTLSSYLIYKTNIELIPVFFLIFMGIITLPIILKSKVF